MLIALSVIKPLQRVSKLAQNVEEIRESAEAIEEGVDPRRLTFVRIQKPKPLLMGLRIGGQMRGMGWKDVAVEAYETKPKTALAHAVEDYDGYRISHYVEQHPDVELDEPLEQIPEESWEEVVPERDLPDEP